MSRRKAAGSGMQTSAILAFASRVWRRWFLLTATECMVLGLILALFLLGLAARYWTLCRPVSPPPVSAPGRPAE